ncbi:MAG: YgcG family protein [Chthoniobacterales bacterium]
MSLDEYTLRVANSWGVGRRDKKNGVTLFVFVADRKMRIQVGDGLTPLLTDELSKRILDEQLKPAFEKHEFDRGLAHGVDSIVRAISGRAVDDKVSEGENGV